MHLLGPFALTDDAGVPLTPRSQKAQAILAMLALARRGARSRVWLRDKLWSDRSEEQASASLRQALSEIRKSLGPAHDLVQADKTTVYLSQDQIQLDLNQPATGSIASEHLLEGMDIRDPEFEEWLTLERQSWLARAEQARSHNGHRQREAVGTSHSSAVSDVPAWDRGASLGGRLLMGSTTESAATTVSLKRFLMRVQPPQVIGIGEKGRIIALQLQSLLTRSLSESLGIDVDDLSFDTGLTASEAALAPPAAVLPITVRIRLTFDGDAVLAQSVVKRRADGALIWSDQQMGNGLALRYGSLSDLHPIVPRTVDQVGHYLLSHGAEMTNPTEDNMLQAIDSIFRLSRDDLAFAERVLQRCIQQWPSGTAYAWLAFIRTFQAGQRFTVADAQVMEEARAYAKKALELEPNNSVCLALVGHVHSFLFGNFEYASRLFEKSINLNPSQPLGWDLYAMLHCFTGEPEKAVTISRWVNTLVSNSRYKYYFDTTRCVSAALVGDHATAIEAGEEALRERPQFNSVLRYLASSYAHANQGDTAHEYLWRLQEIEPDVSISTLLESRYPLLETDAGQSLITGLVKAGLRTR